MDAWGVTQQREHNLRTFQGQTVVRRRGTKRVRSRVFQPWQIAVAERVTNDQKKVEE